MADSFSIVNTTRNTLPHVPFLQMKDAVLGKNYSLSLVFIGETKSKKLNFSYRGVNRPTNVLSFPIDKKIGEVFITPKVVKQQTKEFGRKFPNLVAFLFIHGLLHLKGMGHGSTMERAEVQLRRKFKI